MSLLAAVDPAHADSLAELARELESGTLEDRAILLNLTEENRVEDGPRAELQTRLVAARGTAKERLAKSCSGLTSLLSVSAGPGTDADGSWYTHLTLRKLQMFGFVSGAALDGAEAAPVLTLRRRIGVRDDGVTLPFWITDSAPDAANDVRDTLGLAHVGHHETFYRVEIPLSPGRTVFVPTALDAGCSAPWRRPPHDHAKNYGLTRHLETDAAMSPELLATSEPSDPLRATLVGVVTTAPSDGYLRARLGR